MNDPIHKPAHYTFGRFEVIDVLEVWHVSYDDFCNAPAELLDEWTIRIQARNTVELKQAKRAEMERKGSGRKR